MRMSRPFLTYQRDVKGIQIKWSRSLTARGPEGLYDPWRVLRLSEKNVVLARLVPSNRMQDGRDAVLVIAQQRSGMNQKRHREGHCQLPSRQYSRYTCNAH